MHTSIHERFWSKVAKGPICWTWTASKGADGYGRIKVGGKSRLAHVVSWEMANGPVPDGLELDHICTRRECVNPAHLEPVTHAENLRRASASYGDRPWLWPDADPAVAVAQMRAALVK